MVAQRTVCQKEIEDCTTRGLLDLQRGRVAFGIAALQAAYEKSFKDESGALRSSCAFNLGAALVAAGDAERALPVLRKIPAEHFGPRGALHLNIALCLELLQKEEAALQEFEFAYEAMDAKDSDLNTRAEIAAKLAKTKESNSRWAEASKWYHVASELYCRLHQPQLRAQLLMRHAENAVKAGEVAKAKIALENTGRVLHDVTESPMRGQLFCELGVLLLHRNEVEAAVEALRSALPDLPTGLIEATARQNLGAALNVQQKFEEAIPEHRAAIKLFGEIGARAAQGHSFVNLATAESELGKKEDAAKSFTHALQAAEDSHDLRTQWQCLEALGVFAFNTGEFVNSVDKFERAIELTTAPEERQQLVRRLERALEQRQNVERLRANPNLNAKVSNSSESESESSEEEDEDDEEFEASSEVSEAMDRVTKAVSGHKRKNWKRFYGRKSTREKMFPNPKRNRVLLVNDAVLVPVDREDGAESTSSGSTEDSSQDSDSSKDSSESEAASDDDVEEEEEDQEEEEAVRANYKKALMAPAIEQTRDRLEELAKRYGDEEQEEKEEENSETSQEVAQIASGPPTLPHYPGTMQLEGRGNETYEDPRRMPHLQPDDNDGTGIYDTLNLGQESPPRTFEPSQFEDLPLPRRLEDFPRGDRERVLYEQHQAMLRDSAARGGDKEGRSKTCIVL